MAILKVANVHFNTSGTSRIEHLNNDNVVRVIANAMVVPVGGTGNRPPGTPGLIRYNLDNGNFEGYNASAWGTIGGGSDVGLSFDTANAAFTKANSAYDYIVAIDSSSSTAGGQATNARNTANAALLKANSANYYAYLVDINAKAAFASVNAAYTLANTKYPSTGGTISGSVTVTGDETINGTLRVNTLTYPQSLVFPDGTQLSTAFSIFVPPGCVAYFAMQTIPAGWLNCNGSIISRTTYASLFNAIGTVFGVGDGTTTFQLPDLRGEFIRTWDGARGVDANRVFGSFQDATAFGLWIYQAAYHQYINVDRTAAAGFNTSRAGAAGYTSAQSWLYMRPRNVALRAYIKY